ncbi:hypothetical protein DEU56DRAFT_797974 [Suillus clintonianus]|uniref:uncharacterized protein n=1 Tax=Suillus clintonianus TaxID=1904413 RepID=UPI001B876337|nr:uncharacterized protein DEU56DRAFT_797974 [Suillus clintonianus]KAG2140658.1 hypothetical protein DEU56DRAFT_797974 [Suillus clintonianus]
MYMLEASSPDYDRASKLKYYPSVPVHTSIGLCLLIGVTRKTSSNSSVYGFISSSSPPGYQAWTRTTFTTRKNQKVLQCCGWLLMFTVVYVSASFSLISSE